MRLKSIKLVGFKSFVDPVTVPFDNNMTAIVGPNGCGKSNVIDAVRWVMGESSAKMLRGESMADVIFNGSTGRKPVGQASIELAFDNREGKIGGAYAQYAEIAVKRLVTRDGQSLYYFNGQKCRRRDIADLFLGTGLGPRSYAIIGQGMISRLVEARPEELRATLEEAAGISKYKERRRETENRMRRTQENLERLDDLREELDKQLERLKRQADAARRYQELKEREYRLKGELALIRSRTLRARQHEAETRVRTLEIDVEKNVFGVRESENRLEQSRGGYDEASSALENHQARFYETGATIARLEQSLESARAREQQLIGDIESLGRDLADLDRIGAEDTERLAALEARLETLIPEQEEAAEQLDVLAARLDEAEATQQDAQEAWERFAETDREAGREAERAQSDIRRLDATLDGLDKQLARRDSQLAELPDVSMLREEREALAEQLSECALEQEALEARREHEGTARERASERIATLGRERDTLIERQHALQGEKASLDALIRAALVSSDETFTAHLEAHGLERMPSLAEHLHVDGGWQDAVAWVLAPWLTARVAPLSEFYGAFEQLATGELAVVDAMDATDRLQGTLAEQVHGAGALTPLLGTIRLAEDAAAAWALRDGLTPGESVLTRDGLWLGRHWARRRGENESADSVIAQRQRRDEVVLELTALTERLAALEEALSAARERLAQGEQALEQLRIDERALSDTRQQAALKEANLATRLEHVDGRQAELVEEIEALKENRAAVALELEAERDRWQVAMDIVEANSATRERLEQARREAQEHVTAMRAQLAPARERSSRLELERSRLTTERDGLESQRTRGADQQERLAEKRALLAEQLEEIREPFEETREQLDELLDQRSQQEEALNACRDRAQQLAETMRQLEHNRQQHERNLEALRSRLEEARMHVQEQKLKADAQDEQLAEWGHDATTLLEQLPVEASEAQWQSELDSVGDKIRRLGAINLAAIEEFDQQAERRDYLEAQHGELSEALDTLDKAIRKIDQETRVRFKQTFDEVNAGLGELFPKVFGGGAAWLTLTGDDLLETGVAIMARPPGKKNSTIHLLSGGEKTMTALSLVFAIFQLNPAPFCMLDEVDAPLDDANVGRYAKLVRDMSETVQFIYITHNKIAMEAADRLMGVTMQEPGVSRLVAVGVEEAAALAEA